MDVFLSDIQTSVYKQWILGQKINDCEITLNPGKFENVTLETAYGYAKVGFYDNNIIELSVFSSLQEPKFYLHFQMNNLAKAVKFFKEMTSCLIDLHDNNKTKILLCCSDGFTTSFFAKRMRSANELLALGYEIDATGYNHLKEIGNEYDVILLAPQISYLLVKVKNYYLNKVVLNIPSLIFAKYDVKGIFKLIEEKMQGINRN